MQRILDVKWVLPCAFMNPNTLHVSFYIPLAFKVNLALLKFMSSKAASICSSTYRNSINSETFSLGSSFCSEV